MQHQLSKNETCSDVHAIRIETLEVYWNSKKFRNFSIAQKVNFMIDRRVRVRRDQNDDANVVASFVVNWVGFCVRKGKGEESTFLEVKNWTVQFIFQTSAKSAEIEISWRRSHKRRDLWRFSLPQWYFLPSLYLSCIS